MKRILLTSSSFRNLSLSGAGSAMETLIKATKTMTTRSTVREVMTSTLKQNLHCHQLWHLARSLNIWYVNTSVLLTADVRKHCEFHHLQTVMPKLDRSTFTWQIYIVVYEKVECFDHSITLQSTCKSKGSRGFISCGSLLSVFSQKTVSEWLFLCERLFLWPIFLFLSKFRRLKRK